MGIISKIKGRQEERKRWSKEGKDLESIKKYGAVRTQYDLEHLKEHITEIKKLLDKWSKEWNDKIALLANTQSNWGDIIGGRIESFWKAYNGMSLKLKGSDLENLPAKVYETMVERTGIKLLDLEKQLSTMNAQQIIDNIKILHELDLYLWPYLKEEGIV